MIVLKRVGVYARAYADDLAILVGGEYGYVVPNLIQMAVSTTETFYPDKTSIMMITHRKNLSDTKDMKMY